MGTLTFYPTPFENMHMTNPQEGGATWIKSITSGVFDSSLFNNVSTKGSQGACRLEDFKQCLLMHNCSFDNSTASENYIGCMELLYIKVLGDFSSNSSSHGVLFGCRFYD
jgi:hypothetical protein